MTRPRRAAPALALTMLAAACADGGGSGSGGAPPDPGVPFLEAHNATVAPLLPANAFALPEMDAVAYQELIGQVNGTPVVVNIWGSWCPPCRSEAPLLAAAADRYGDDVQFLGVDILDVREAARDFMREFGWNFPSVYDETGEIRDELGFFGQPNTLFYGADGNAKMVWAGPIDERTLERGIQRILP